MAEEAKFRFKSHEYAAICMDGYVLVVRLPSKAFGNMDAYWSALLAFTRDHMRKIAQMKEQVDQARKELDTYMQAEAIVPVQIKLRTVEMLDQALAALRRGVRPEYQDGRMEGL